MATDVLIRFLQAGLINVGGDDTKLERLKETSGDLAAALKKNPSNAAPYALIAFDPKAPAQDPVVQEALAALQARWATYVNTFSGTPISIVRAMLLHALVQASAEDEKVGVAFVASARNALPFMEVDNERAIWGEVISEVERAVDTRAEAEWATPEAINAPAMNFAPPEAIEVSLTIGNPNKALLAKKFEAAGGPHNAAGQATGGNPHWPNNGQSWLTEFGTRAAEAVAEAMSTAAKASAIGPVDLSGPLNSLAQVVSTHVTDTLKAVSGATAGLQRRTNLIWWKETLYSPSARVSYRTVPATTAGALMAFDLHKQVPTFSPASVVAFLNETVLTLPEIDASKRYGIRDLLDGAKKSAELAELRQVASQLVPERNGRGPIVGLLGQGRGQDIDDARFVELVGVPAETLLTIPEWATWLFRELQAARAAQEGPEQKKRGRKPL